MRLLRISAVAGLLAVSMSSSGEGRVVKIKLTNGLKEAITVRYSSPNRQGGCGTLAPGDSCVVDDVLGEFRYCWWPAASGKDCDPQAKGCTVKSQDVKIDGGPSSASCRAE